MAYDDGLHNTVTDTTMRFQILEQGEVVEEYQRLNDVVDSYKTQVTVVKDANRDGRVERDEVKHMRLEYWDYCRQTRDAGGQPVTQFLFVEMDAENGWFQLWQGRSVDPQKVLVA
jgi:hypothetical protein